MIPFLLKEKSFLVKKKNEFDNYGIFKNMKKILLEDVSVKKNPKLTKIFVQKCVCFKKTLTK